MGTHLVDDRYASRETLLKMLKFVVTLALVASACAVDLSSEWGQFKVKFSKTYDSMEEEGIRRSIWEKHHAYILEHNKAYAMGESTFFLGENEFMDMHNDEFVQKMNGYQGRSGPSNNLVHTNNEVTDLPDTVDWRDKGYITPVKNQKQCGSCWAFSTTGSLEGQWFKKTGTLPSLSEQNLVDCSRKQGNQGCEGGLMDNAFSYIKQNGGIDTEKSYPYKGTNGKCHFTKANIGANDTGYVDVKAKDENALQEAVATVGPISVAIDASHMSFQLYAGGVYHNWFCSETRLDHGVLAVGYGNYEGKDFWMVKNSWGPTWGLKGYIMMSRNRHNNCGIASQASYPKV